MGAVVDFKPPMTVDEAFERYCALVNERAEKNLWTDLEHNKELARAWERWAHLFNLSEREP